MLRCPDCEQGRIFKHPLTIKPVCDYCCCRFERGAGELMGAVLITVTLAKVSALAGIFFAHIVFDVPLLHQLLFWVLYIPVFIILSFRYMCGLWLGFLYLNGAIYPDQDYEYGEFIRVPRIQRRTQHENDLL